MVGPGEPGLGPLGWVWTQVLVDNSARVNLVMLAYVWQLKLGVCLISDLDHSLNLFRCTVIKLPSLKRGEGRFLTIKS